MSNFQPTAAAVAKHFDKMSQGELYRVDLEGDALWQAYLAAFPEGTNPIYRVRTEHDGSYDRSFIRKLGNVVAITADGKFKSIWDTPGLAAPYDTVFSVLSALVRNAPIKSLFRIKEQKLSIVSNIELRDGVTTKFYHYNATIDPKHFTKEVDTVVGNANTTVDVFRRGMEEVSRDAVDTVLDLIESKTLYRGEEFVDRLRKYRALMRKYDETDDQARSIMLWQNYDSPVARMRNTAIGTLLVDLSEGKDLERAVKSYEGIMAPTNYKRPTALITKGMIEAATTKIREMGLEPALERRHAKLSDISVNNVLWVDNSVQDQMKDSLTSMLMAEVKQPAPTKDNATEITIGDFMKHVLPQTTTLELFLGNKHRVNLMSLTAPVHPEAPTLFKWDNGFAWSYNGDITDSELRQAVAARGGRVDGVFRFSHSWNHSKRNASLMDLHVLMPGNSTTPKGQNNTGNDQRVGWNHRSHRASGGVQDVDYVQPAPVGYVPVENITFPDLSKMPEGVYRCYIHNWSLRSPTQGGFRAEIEFDGQIFEYEYDKPLKNHEWVHVANVTLRSGLFDIEHKLPSSASSQKVWGLTTQQFVKVNTVMFSPNHWDEKAVGNKHWFFLLDGCLNDEPTRGIYNEFLKPELETHRKVFEVLGSKTKCQPTPEQLSGLGFSSTKRDSVLAKVTNKTSTKLYEILF